MARRPGVPTEPKSSVLLLASLPPGKMALRPTYSDWRVYRGPACLIKNDKSGTIGQSGLTFQQA